jgi:hypothetical protein
VIARRTEQDELRPSGTSGFKATDELPQAIESLPPIGVRGWLGWILHKMALAMADQFARDGRIVPTVIREPHSSRGLRRIEATHDVLHFMYEARYLKLADRVRRAALVTTPHVSSYEANAWRAAPRYPDLVLTVGTAATDRILEIIAPRQIAFRQVAYGLDCTTYSPERAAGGAAFLNSIIGTHCGIRLGLVAFKIVKKGDSDGSG